MRRSLAVVGGLALGVALSQFPEYAQQYTQRLGGAVDELRIITTDFDVSAATSGLSREAALARYTQSPDLFLAGRGLSMSDTFARYAQLSATLAEITGADALTRLRLLPRYLDSDIGARTLDNFKPAVPVTPEGLLYGGAGLVLGYLLMSALYSLLTLPFRRLFRPRAHWADDDVRARSRQRNRYETGQVGAEFLQESEPAYAPALDQPFPTARDDEVTSFSAAEKRSDTEEAG